MRYSAEELESAVDDVWTSVLQTRDSDGVTDLDSVIEAVRGRLLHVDNDLAVLDAVWAGLGKTWAPGRSVHQPHLPWAHVTADGKARLFARQRKLEAELRAKAAEADAP